MPRPLHPLSLLLSVLLLGALTTLAANAGAAQARAGGDQAELALTPAERAWLADHPEIRIGVMNAWPPFGFVDAEGEPQGISVELVRALDRRLDASLVIVPGNWAELLAAARAGRVDVLMDATARESREPYLDFTRPYLSIPHVIVARKGTPYIGSVAELAGRTVALERGFGNVERLRTDNPDITVKEYPDTALALDAVARGEADAYVGNRAVVTYLMRREVLVNLEVHGRLDAPGSVLGIATREDWPQLQGILQKALDSLGEEELAAILAPWAGPVEETAERPGLSAAERAWLERHPVVRVAIDPDWAPMEYRNEQGRFTGISRDYLDALEDLLGVRFEAVPGLSWQQGLAAVKTRQADMFASVARTPEREAYVRFTRPYVHIPIRIFARDDAAYIGTLDNLAGARVAVVEGYAIHDWLQADRPRLELVLVPTPAAGLERVAAGDAEAFIGNVVTAHYYLGKLGIHNVRVAGDTPYTNSQAMAVRSDWPELVDILQKGLDAIPEERHQAIFNRWMSVRFERAIDYDLLWQLAAVAGLVLLASLYWNRRLAAEVAQRKDAEARLKDYQATLERRVDERTAALRDSEERFRTTFARAALGIARLSLKGRFLEVNQKLCDITGHGEADLMGCSLHDLTHPDDREEDGDPLAPLVSGESSSVGAEKRLVRPSGVVVWVSLTLSLVRGAEGRPAYLVALVEDITERKRTDARLREAAAVFDSTAEGVVITDREGTITEVNEAFTRITGYSRAEAVGGNPSMLQSHRQDPAFYQAMWRSLEETGEWRGEIWNRRKDGSVYPELLTISSVHDPHGNPSGFVGVFTDITNLKQTEERLDHLAHHDPLTDLPNRLLFNARLHQSILHAVRQRTELALVFIDLDRFKNINDSLGHTAGDALLKEVAGRLKDALRADDTVARLGGDEFVVMLEDIGGADHAMVAVSKLMAAFHAPFRLEDKEVRVTASMGLSLFPRDGDDASTLLRNADAAMYHAKDEGRNTYQFYTEELTTAAFERLFIENALPGALAQQEFRLVYQPQVELASGRCIGAEALLRWQHPERGAISPARFIPIAEQSGFIRELGTWVLRSACVQGRAWLDAGLSLGRVAVNVSGPQLQQEDFVQVVQRVLEESGLPARHLALEVTEGFVMRRPEASIKRLKRLRQLGIEIAIDDFGTGYASLSYLKQLPIDKLKIDQSFVRDIPTDADDRAISEAVIAMGEALKMRVIAEGVETEEHAVFLRAKGCAEAQGYLYSRPLEAADVPQFLGRC